MFHEAPEVTYFFALYNKFFYALLFFVFDPQKDFCRNQVLYLDFFIRIFLIELSSLEFSSSESSEEISMLSVIY